MLVISKVEVKKMLVKDVIKKIENKEMQIKKLAEIYNVSDRTIQTKIKKLGFKWNSNNTRYDFVGEDDSVLDIDFSSLFMKPKKLTREEKTNIRKASIKANNSRNTKTSTNINTNASTNTNASNNTGSKRVDVIDLLLAGEKATEEKVYRGFYLDKDISEIIDKAPKAYKSKLVNEALRKVFEDKGIL